MSLLKADPVSRETWIDCLEDGLTDPEDITAKTGLNRFGFPTQRQYSELLITPGLGYCLTTYGPGSQELPSFEGEPFIVPIQGELEDVMEQFWDALEPEWIVALCGKEIIPGGSWRLAEPINRFAKVTE